MLRLLSKHKVPFSFPTRFFSHQLVNPLWKRLSEKDRIDYALAAREPENAEVAFYRGRGFKAMGSEHAGAAIAAFEEAAKMDHKYSPASKMEIAFIYEEAGQPAEACKHFDSAYRELIQVASKAKETAEPMDIMDVMNVIALPIEEMQEKSIRDATGILMTGK